MCNNKYKTFKIQRLNLYKQIQPILSGKPTHNGISIGNYVETLCNIKNYMYVCKNAIIFATTTTTTNTTTTTTTATTTNTFNVNVNI